MPPIKHIALIGTGAMGSFYASKFFDMDPNCIRLIAGGPRADRLKKHGFFVNGQPYHIPVISIGDMSPPSDLVMVAVKHHDLPQAIEDIKNRVGEETVLLSVMNGIDSEAQLGARYGKKKVLYAVAVGIDAVREDNRLTYTTQGKLLFGEETNAVLSERVKRLQSLFDSAGIHHETPTDMRRILWWKFMINVGINQASSLLRANYSEFVRSKAAKDLMESAMREVTAIAEKEGVDLNEKDIDAWNEILAANMSSEGKTSMLQDVEAHRKTEVEMLAGKVIELGKRHNVPTPVNEKLFKAIKEIEAENGIPEDN